jgi:hypothetical protein
MKRTLLAIIILLWAGVAWPIPPMPGTPLGVAGGAQPYDADLQAYTETITAGGTADALTADFTTNITPAAGTRIRVIAAAANTATTPTLAVDGATARTIVKQGGTALVVGDIAAAGHILELQYDLANTRWELLNPKYPIAIGTDAPGISGTITDEQLLCGENTDGTNKIKSCGAKTTYTEPVSNIPLCRTGAGTTGGCTNITDIAAITASSSDTLTNKTIDVDGTGNVLKTWGYLILTHPHLCAAGAPMQTTTTAKTFGQCKFGNATDKATNYAEYYLVVPADIDTSIDLTATFKIQLSDADTGDHEYEISFDSVANSAAYAGSLGDAISLAYTADASGAANDVETAGETTLTGWRSAMTAGQLFVIRVARDGDHENDTSTVDSYSGPLVIKYKITQ